MPLLHGDLGRLDEAALAPMLEADLFVVFGASYIKGGLIEILLDRRAVNIHMGVSPMYRGSSCNFWALYDRRPEYVGGTVHLLTKGLDSGDILFHCLPPAVDTDPFTLGMLAVRSALEGLASHIENKTLYAADPVHQDKSAQLRYSRGTDFTDEIAQEYLGRMPTPSEIGEALRHRDLSKFVNPVVAG